MKIVKLSSMPYANAEVRIDDEGIITLISYTTPVAQIANDWLTVGGLYSMTTRKHIGAFVKEYANTTYQTAKWLYENDHVFNINTGEIKEWEEVF